MYKQIKALHLMCCDRQISHTIEPLFDGFKITLSHGEDIVQQFAQQKRKNFVYFTY